MSFAVCAKWQFKRKSVYFPKLHAVYIHFSCRAYFVKLPKLPCIKSMGYKGLVKLIQWIKIAHSLSVCTCVKSVPLHHFKFPFVVLHMAVKELFKTTSKNVEIRHFNLECHFFYQLLKSVAVYCFIRTFCFVFITSENMPCTHMKQ